MELTFLGGASEVGSLGLVLETGGTKLLLDYGMTPSKPPKFPSEAPPVDAFFLSHCHIDHSGMSAWVTSEHRVPMYTNSLTHEVTELLLHDSLKIAKYEGHMVPFAKKDIQIMNGLFKPIAVHEPLTINDVELNFHSAGHIPGALMAEIKGEQRILFTGDINTIDTRLVKGNEPVKCDTLILESTYSGRDHDPRQQIENNFVEKIYEVLDRGGTAIVPSFAVGRTQELLLILSKLEAEIWLDGMGDAVTRIYFSHPDSLGDVKKLKRAYRRTRLIKHPGDRKKAVKGDVILTTSGMLDGGPVMEYLKWLKDDQKNALLLTGYQVEGTNGRMVMEEGMMDFYGVKERLNLELEFFDFSAHAGHKELVEFARGCKPENLVLCHGENREAIKSELGDEINVILPVENKTESL